MKLWCNAMFLGPTSPNTIRIRLTVSVATTTPAPPPTISAVMAAPTVAVPVFTKFCPISVAESSRWGDCNSAATRAAPGTS